MSQAGRPIAIAYLGPKATYCHQAALQLFNTDSESAAIQLLPYPTIDSLFEAVTQGDVDFSVVPLANSTNGSVAQTLKAMVALTPSQSIEACGSTLISVRHCLAGRRPVPIGSNGLQHQASLDDGASFAHIKSLHTHSQAWSQCTPFLTSHFGSDIARVSENSTSEAAARVAADQTGQSAAICSALAAQLFKLDILADEIQSDDKNKTRFLVVRQRKSPAAVMPPMRQNSSIYLRGQLHVCEIEAARLEDFDMALRTRMATGSAACTTLSLGTWQIVLVEALASSLPVLEQVELVIRSFTNQLWRWGHWESHS